MIVNVRQSKRLLNKEDTLCHIKTSNAEGPVDFINTYDLEPMATSYS